jgi:hypothetical protein
MSYELSGTPSSIHNSYTYKPLTHKLLTPHKLLTHKPLFTHSCFLGREIRGNHRDNYHD